jgi:hypothetical protein
VSLLWLLFVAYVEHQARLPEIQQRAEERKKETELASRFPPLELFGKTTATLRSGQLAAVEYHIRFQPTAAVSPRDVLSEINPHIQFLVRAWASAHDETTITSHGPLWSVIQSEVRSLVGRLQEVSGYALLKRAAAAAAPARLITPRPNTKPHQFTFGDDRRVTLHSDDNSRPSIEAIQLLDPTELE